MSKKNTTTERIEKQLTGTRLLQFIRSYSNDAKESEGGEESFEDLFVECLAGFLEENYATNGEAISRAVVAGKMKNDTLLSPFNVTAEYRLGELRGYNQAIIDLLKTPSQKSDEKL